MDWVAYWQGRHRCSSPSIKGFHDTASLNKPHNTLNRLEPKIIFFISGYQRHSSQDAAENRDFNYKRFMLYMGNGKILV